MSLSTSLPIPTPTTTFALSTITTPAQPTSTDDIDTSVPPITTLRDFKIGIIVGVIFVFLLIAGVTVLLVWRWKWHKREVVYAESLRSYRRVPGNSGSGSGVGRAARFIGNIGLSRKGGEGGGAEEGKGDKFAGDAGGVVVGVSEYDRECELEGGHESAGRGR